jgi:hypothetical protein
MEEVPARLDPVRGARPVCGHKPGSAAEADHMAHDERSAPHPVRTGYYSLVRSTPHPLRIGYYSLLNSPLRTVY